MAAFSWGFLTNRHLIHSLKTILFGRLSIRHAYKSYPRLTPPSLNPILPVTGIGSLQC